MDAENVNDKGYRPPLDFNKFIGKFPDLMPEAKRYKDTNVSFGMWTFTLKFPKSDNGEISSTFAGVYRNGFMAYMEHYGFYKKFRKDNSYFFLRCVDNIIEEIDPINISDFLMKHQKEKGNEISFIMNIDGQQVEFVATIELQDETIKRQCSSIFSKKFLELLPTFEKEILKDTATECYKLFKNKIYKITAEGFTEMDYKDLDGKCVWKNHIIDREIILIEDFNDCNYYKFLYNVSDAENDLDRHISFKSSIGYLLHKYNSPEKGQCIILYDEVITDITKPQGGTGKGVFARALSFLSDLVKIDGKKFDENDRFCFQRVSDSTQIVFFDDVKTKLGFDRFNSILTDGWNIEKKNKDEFPIPPEDSPKVLMSANSILDCEGSTRKRRQHILEFANYYSKHIVKGNEEPIKQMHGCIFFSADWDDTEWNKFYSFMLNCIWDYMKDGLYYYEPKNVKSNRLRQTTCDDFAEWVSQQNFELNKTYETKQYFEEYKSTYCPDENFHQRKFTGWLKKVASLNDWAFSQPKPSGGVTFFRFNGVPK